MPVGPVASEHNLKTGVGLRAGAVGMLRSVDVASLLIVVLSIAVVIVPVRAQPNADCVHAGAMGVMDRLIDDPDPPPGFPAQDLLVARAAGLIDCGRTNEAMTDLNRAMALEPGHTPSLLLRSRLHMAIDNPVAAAADLTAAMEHLPADPALLVRRAEAYRASGDLEAALVDYDGAISLDPTPAIEAARAAILAELRRQ